MSTRHPRTLSSTSSSSFHFSRRAVLAYDPFEVRLGWSSSAKGPKRLRPLPLPPFPPPLRLFPKAVISAVEGGVGVGGPDPARSYQLYTLVRHCTCCDFSLHTAVGERQTKGRGRKRWGELELELQNSKTLSYKDCSLGSVKNVTTSPC